MISNKLEKEIWNWLLTNPLNHFKSEEEKWDLARLDFIAYIENNTEEEIKRQYKQHKQFIKQYAKRFINS
tara:strand:- start:132 stop:341 length:210 start_codon:yes stop_codon:yes gene_type:complete